MSRCSDQPTDEPTVDPLADHLPLGGLERWLADPAVTEVMVNRGTEVWVERHGAVEHVGAIHEHAALAAIEHILTPLGRRLDRTHPAVDARLHDGSRLCAVIPPIAVDGVCLSIRRFGVGQFTLDDFCTPSTAAALSAAINTRRNVVVSGGASSGKTTLLNCLATMVPATERIITLEDTAELRLQHPHVLRLESREPTAEGVGGIDLAMLLRTALRLRPDRLVVGEVRGPEAVHLLHALNTGHTGSLATLHANSPAHAVQRLAALVAEAAPAWSATSVEQLVRNAVDTVVHLERLPDGRRRVVDLVELHP